MENKYSFNIIWSDEDECFVVTIPEFLNLSAFGESIQEAIADAEVVVQMAIDSLNRDGIPLPEPKTHKPEQDYSGQVRLRMPKSLHKDLTIAAEKDGSSLNTHMLYLLSKSNTSATINREIKRTLNKFLVQQDHNFAILHRKLGQSDKPAARPSSKSAWLANPSHEETTILTLH